MKSFFKKRKDNMRKTVVAASSFHVNKNLRNLLEEKWPGRWQCIRNDDRHTTFDPIDSTLCTIMVKIYKDEAQKLLLYKTQASGVDWDEAANEACGLIREGHLELVQSSREIDHRRTFPPDTLHSRIASQKRSLPTISVSQALSAGRELPRVSCSTPDSWRRAPAPLSPRRRTATSSYQGSSTVIGNMAGSEYSSLHVSKAPSSTRKGARS